MLKLTIIFTIIFAICFAKTSITVESESLIIPDSIKVKSIEDLLKNITNSESIRKRRYLETNVSFESCPGPHSDIYDIDDDYSHVEPERISKNNDINLILEGVMGQDVHVDQLKVDVYWNGNLFHSEDHKLDDNIEEQEPYELRFKWFVPGFAPSGKYLVDLIVKAQGQELGCERASFTL